MTISQEKLIEFVCDADLRERTSILKQAAETLTVEQFMAMAAE